MYAKYTILLIITFSICNMTQASENLYKKNEPTLMTIYFNRTIKIKYDEAQLSKHNPFFPTGADEEKYWTISGSPKSLKNEKTLIKLKEAADKHDKQKNYSFIMHEKLFEYEIIKTLEKAGFSKLMKIEKTD